MKSNPSSPSEVESVSQVQVALWCPRTKAVEWSLRFVYFIGLSVVFPPLALFALFTLPLGVPPNNPRRALHLWTMGLASSVAVMGHIRTWATASPLSLAEQFQQMPGEAALYVVGALISIGVLFWHVTWVRSPRLPEEATSA